MVRCDVLVVGGGPAGSSCAWRLAQKRVDVIVLDRAEFPRSKLCAGWITPQVLATAHVRPEEYQDGRVLQPITGFRTGLIGGPHVETRYDTTVSYAIRRSEFDTYLLRRAGARLRLGWAVTSIVRRGDAWVIAAAAASPLDRRERPEASDGSETIEFTAPMLVGAGGHFCPVARALSGAGRRQEPVIAAREVEFEMTAAQQAACPVSSEMPEIYFCRDLAGYGWIVRKGIFLNVGFGRRGAERLRTHVAAFVEVLEGWGRLPPGTPTGWPGHPYLLYESTPRQLLDEGVVLVGDSAGLAYSQSGEGIRPAIESGLLAAETIIKADGRYDRERLEGYRRRLVARLGPPGPRHDLARWLPRSLRVSLARRLLRSGRFARRVLLDRWFLRRNTPPLEDGF
jgi:flavin-dependent dehydrogenase